MASGNLKICTEEERLQLQELDSCISIKAIETRTTSCQKGLLKFHLSAKFEAISQLSENSADLSRQSKASHFSTDRELQI